MPNDNEICANCLYTKKAHRDPNGKVWTCDIFKPSGRVSVPASLLDKVRKILDETMDIVTLDIEETGPCDHEVGVCSCQLISCADRIAAIRYEIDGLNRGDDVKPKKD